MRTLVPGQVRTKAFYCAEQAAEGPFFHFSSNSMLEIRLAKPVVCKIKGEVRIF